MPGPLILPAIWGAKELLTLLFGAGAAYVAGKQLSKNPPKIKFSRSNDYKPYNPPAVKTVSQPAAPVNAQITKEYLDLVAKGVPATLTGIAPFRQKGNYWDYSTYLKDFLKYGPNVMPTYTVVGTRSYAPLMLNDEGQDLYRLQAATKSGKLTDDELVALRSLIAEKERKLSQPEPPERPKWYRDKRFWRGVGTGATMKAAYDLYQGYKNQPTESDSTFNVMYDPNAAKTYIDNVPATEVPAVQSIDTTNVQSIDTPTQQDYFDELYRFMGY